MIEAVVFDLDGVLVDSERVWEEVRRQYVAEHGGRWLPDSQRRLMGMSTNEWAGYISRDLGVGLTPEEVARGVIDRMVGRYSGSLPLLPGAAEAARRMTIGWPLGLASSSPVRLIAVVLESTGLAGCFSVTVSADQVSRGKPAPDVYLLAAERLGVSPERCTAIEDSGNGIRAAHAAGCRVIAVPRPEYPPDQDALALSDSVLSSLDELTDEVVDPER